MTTAQLLRSSWRSWLSNDGHVVGPGWLQWAWTLAFCAVLAVLLTILGFVAYARGANAWRNWAGWWHWYQINFVICTTIGMLVQVFLWLGAAALGRPRVQALAGWRRAAYYGGTSLLGVVAGWPLGLWLVGDRVGRWFSFDQPSVLIGMFLFTVLIALAVYQLFDAKARQIGAEKCATEARLKLLQGQIEPHFLFNTLANVVSLMEADPPRAKRMLETFVGYLRASLGSLREARHTLGDELAVVEAYLQIVAMRMDTRLRYRIDVPDALRRQPMPALLLQPLVENAVGHGLEPKIDGGTVSVSAVVADARLTLTVADDGLGLRAAGHSGAGTGAALANIRERLQEAYGDAAALRVADAPGGGVRATLVLPV